MWTDGLDDLFFKPIQMGNVTRLAMLAPLVLSISIVHKTIHCERLRSIPWASLMLCLTILGVMALIGVGLLLVFRLLA